MAKIEFYRGNAPKFLASVDDGAVPRQGEFINIEGATYQVRRVDWAVDHAASSRRGLRANVVLSHFTDL